MRIQMIRTFVLGTVELQQEVVNGLLVGDIEVGLGKGSGNLVVDMSNGLQNTCEKTSLGSSRCFIIAIQSLLMPTLAHVVLSVSITELKGLVDTSGGTRRHCGTEETCIDGRKPVSSTRFDQDVL